MKKIITNSQQFLGQGAVWQFGLKPNSDIMLWHCASWKFEFFCHPDCENRQIKPFDTI